MKTTTAVVTLIGFSVIWSMLNIFINVKFDLKMKEMKENAPETVFRSKENGGNQYVYEMDSIKQVFSESTWINKSPGNSLILSAFVELSIPFWIRDDTTPTSSFGEPITPLPLRTQSPSELIRFTYPNVQSCLDMPKYLPVDRGRQIDENGNSIPFVNVKNDKVLENPFKEAPNCPVDADPFLPWIHDVFPGRNGDVIHFVAQNKRRCNTGKHFRTEVERLEPQVSLMQPVSVARVSHSQIPKDLWNDDGNIRNESYKKETRWRLSTLDEADENGIYTRFICRFKALNPEGQISILGETLSVFPINYELANKRKAQKSMLTKEGKDQGLMWLSSFQFDCPVPDIDILQQAIRHEKNIIDNKAIVYVDLVPIRTPPRGLDGLHLPESLGYTHFDAENRWGKNHVLPKIEASGRWENIPICSPDMPTQNALPEKQGNLEEYEDARDLDSKSESRSVEKKHILVGCVWASSSYKTRNNGVHVSDTEERMLEWLEYHLLAGFDHIYVYDNTAAHTDNESDLSKVTNLFSPKEVTHIKWPFRVCNNNFPQNENSGERSSQYAAETSCRARYGPETEWMASFDTDEYFIPNGKYSNLKELLMDVKEGGTNILSFKSARSYMNIEDTIPYFDGGECGDSLMMAKCLQKSPNSTYLQTFNCDQVGIPRIKGYTRAKKQIYRPDYVLSHFVHYSVISKPILDMDRVFHFKYEEPSPSERFIDEVNEGFMVHAKTWRFTETIDWKARCKSGYKMNKWGSDKCLVGFPYPLENSSGSSPTENPEGLKYNSFQNKQIIDVWLPKLEEAMEKRKKTVNSS